MHVLERRDSPRLPEFVFAMLTDAGRRRGGNEDCCAASALGGVFLVCDGMGGAASGEVASRVACETFLGQVGAASDEVDEVAARASVAAGRLRAAINAANEAVYRKAERNVAYQGMGTTLVAGLLHPAADGIGRGDEAGDGDARGGLLVAHVGDSRCYRFHEERLELLTVDHSFVEDQVRAGQITREEALLSPMRHVITRAIGSRPQVEAEIRSIELHGGELFLFASDGLNRELEDEEIALLLRGIPAERTVEHLEAGCAALVEAANEHGGRDNVTVLLVAIAAFGM